MLWGQAESQNDGEDPRTQLSVALLERGPHPLTYASSLYTASMLLPSGSSTNAQ